MASPNTTEPILGKKGPSENLKIFDPLHWPLHFIRKPVFLANFGICTELDANAQNWMFALYIYLEPEYEKEACTKLFDFFYTEEIPTCFCFNSGSFQPRTKPLLKAKVLWSARFPNIPFSTVRQGLKV